MHRRALLPLCTVPTALCNLADIEPPVRRPQPNTRAALPKHCSFRLAQRTYPLTSSQPDMWPGGGAAAPLAPARQPAAADGGRGDSPPVGHAFAFPAPSPRAAAHPVVTLPLVTTTPGLPSPLCATSPQAAALAATLQSAQAQRVRCCPVWL